MLTSLASPLKYQLQRVLPASLLHQFAFEIQTSCKSVLTRRYAKRYQSMRGVRLNIGCGDRPTEGWVNFDLISRPKVDYWDCRKGLPFRDGAVSAIFTEHVVEHLEYGDEVEKFLRECLRCLGPSGVLRIVVPDAGVYLKLYCTGAWNEIMTRRPLIQEGDHYRDFWLGQHYFTKMEFINALFRQNGEHRYAYDAETLIRLLEQVGFATVRQTRFGVSTYANMAPDTPERGPESLYVEAIKTEKS